MASPARSNTLGVSSHAGPNVSPRLDPLRSLGDFTVQFIESEIIGQHVRAFHVNCNFKDIEQQNRVFSQLLALEHAGIQRMEFSLRVLHVDFVFVSEQDSNRFVERVKRIATHLLPQGVSQASPDFSPRVNPSSEVSLQPPFSRWKQIITEFSTETNTILDQTDFAVKITFSDFDNQKLVRRELTELVKAGVIYFAYSFKEPVVKFIFFDEGKARNFMQKFEIQNVPALRKTGDDSKFL